MTAQPAQSDRLPSINGGRATGRGGARGNGRGAAGSNYTARHLLVLEGLEAVRKRPGMYIGSTDSRGLMHCLWEIIDNSVDEALAAVTATDIEVILHDDGSVEVRDNGRGIPVDVEPKTGLSGVEVVMTKLHAGGKFGGGSYAASGGLHGVGASVVNALSARLDVEVDRGGTTHAISFRRGVPGIFTDGSRARPRARSTRPSACASCGSRAAEGAHRHPGALLGGPADLPQGRQALSTTSSSPAARQTAFLVPGLTIVVRDERGSRHARRSPAEETFRFDGGISEFCEYLAHGQAGLRRLRLTGQGTFKETVPVLDERGHMTPHRGHPRARRRHRACAGAPATTPSSRSFVNIIATPKGGTHVDRLRAGSVTKTVNEVLRGQRKLLRVAEDDSRQGRRPGGPDRGRHRPAGRAAVRGPDQGGARHLGGQPDRRQGRRPRSSRRS